MKTKQKYIIWALLGSALWICGCDASDASCEQDEVACDGSSLLTCVDGHWQEDVCQYGCNMGKCYETQACMLDTGVCRGDILYSCDSGTETTMRCLNGCVDGACYQSQSCTVNKPVCDGNVLYSCKDEIEQAVTCVHGCSDGKCYETDACRLNQPACVGDVLYACQSGMEVKKVCRNGCSDGKCIESVACNDDEVYCEGDMLHTCTNGVDHINSCENGCSNGKCNSTQACKTHQAVCLDNMLFVCVDGEEVYKKCPDVCDNGKCIVSEPCVNNHNYCDGDMLRTCSDDMEHIVVCDHGCSGGRCNISQACKMNQHVCIDNLLYACVQGEEVYKECQNGCSNGACIADIVLGHCGDKYPGFECGERSTCNEEEGFCMPWSVRGRILYEKPVFRYDEVLDVSRVQITEYIPASGVTVQIVDESQSVIGESQIDEKGYFTVDIPRLPLSTDSVYMPLIRYRKDDSVCMAIAEQNVDRFNAHKLWAFSFPLRSYSGDADPGNLNDIKINISKNSGLIDMFRGFSNAYDLIEKSDFPMTLASLAVEWSDGNISEDYSGYFDRYEQDVKLSAIKIAKFDNGIVMNGGNDYLFMGDTYYHEFGHYLMNHFRDDTMGGDHSYEIPSDPRLALSEGWASFSSVLFNAWMNSQIRAERINTYYSNGYSYTVNYKDMKIIMFYDGSYDSYGIPYPSLTISDQMGQLLAESWVTRFFMDIWDGSEFPDVEGTEDPVALSIKDIWAVLGSNRYLNADNYSRESTSIGVDVVDFVDAMLCLNLIKDETAFYAWLIDTMQFPYDRSPVCN